MLPLLKSIFSDWPIAAPLLVGFAIALSVFTVAAVLLDRRCRSQSAMSWVLLVLIAPLVGPIVYWIFGKAWLSAKRERAYAAVAAERREMRLREEAGGASHAARLASRPEAREMASSVASKLAQRAAARAVKLGFGVLDLATRRR